MSMFDPQNFLSTTVEEANATQYTPIPAGEYTAILKKLDAREQPKKDGSEIFTIIDITYSIEDEAVREATGMTEPTVRQSLFLDMNEGKLDTGKGKNVDLGRLREALGCNEDGVPFSFNDLLGKACVVTVIHKPNPNDPDQVYANVGRVGAM